MNRTLLGLLVLLLAGQSACGGDSGSGGNANCTKNCGGDGDGNKPGDGDGNNPGDGDGNNPGDGDKPGDGDGGGDGDQPGDGDGGDGDNTAGGLKGMLPDGVDPTKPETIPADPDPGNTTMYEELLRKAVRFYGQQRCGDGHNWMLADDPDGNECHMQDGQAFDPASDMTGGWHDAGDNLKFTLTNAWASYALLKAFDTYPDAFDDEYDENNEYNPNGIPDVLDQAKYAVDYLVKLNHGSSDLISRIGGRQDHNQWVSSPAQSKLGVDQGGGARPVNPYDTAHADLAGITAASLAIMSRLWKAHDAELAATYLQHARDVYEIGDKTRGLTKDKLDSEDDDQSFYADSSYEDDMLCGAVELLRVTGEAKYRTAAAMWDDIVANHDYTVDWSNPTDLCRHTFARIGAADDTMNYWTMDANHYLASVSKDAHVVGLAWFDDWGSLVGAAGAASSAALYWDLTGKQEYRDFAQGQLAYILGDNEYARSFVVDYGNNPPQHPHDRNGSVLGITVTGALVGGPTKADTEVSTAGYQDDQGNYVGNEVAIDYNTGLVNLAAFMVAQERRNK
jgi:endoglucanase